MKKTLCIESSLKRYLGTLKRENSTTGLLLGQNSVEKDFVVHLARTQTRKNSENVKEIGDLKKEDVIEHIRNVIQILPGGMTILGLFFIGDASLLNATALRAVKGILNAIDDYQTDNQYYFFDTNSSSKYIIHYVDNTNITCKQFSSSQGVNQFDVVDLVFSSNSWHRVSSYYDFENLLPLYLETVSNAILQDKFMEILKHVSQSVKESVLLFNGEMKNESDFIKSLRKRSMKETSQSKPNEDDGTRIIVDLYTPSASRIPNFPTRISDYVAELKCFGTLCSDVYLHDNATVSEVIKAVKEDIIRSLCSRLTMHHQSLLEDLSSSGLDETKIIHEPPRRISVRLPYSRVRFTDYLFPGEDNMSSLPAREQLDLRDAVDEKSQFEALEMENDASLFHNREDDKLEVKGNSSSSKKNVTFKISVGIALALLLIVFAVLLQKLRFL